MAKLLCCVVLVDILRFGMSSTEVNDQPPLLALPWRIFDVNLSAFTINGLPLSINEQHNTGKGTGLNVWDGAIALAKFLEYSAIEEIRDNTALELGAGTGLVGLAACFLGSKKSILTDLDYCLQNIKENVQLNEQKLRACGSQAEVLELDWLNPNLTRIGMVDVVLAADVIWLEELIKPLLLVISKIFQTMKNRCIGYMSYQSRSKRADEILFHSAQEVNLRLTEIDESEYHPQFKSGKIQIFKISREWMNKSVRCY